MAIPSRVLGAGNSALSTVNICGDAASVVQAGASAGAATQISAIVNLATTASAGGLKLPKCEAGAEVFIYNASGNTATVYPTTGDTINATTSVSLADGKARLFKGTSATAWYSMLGA